MLHADHIVIEAQCNPNTTMKVISHAIQMYFSCRLRTPVINKIKGLDNTVIEKRIGKPQSFPFSFFPYHLLT